MLFDKKVKTMKLALSDLEFELLINLFSNLMDESKKQMELCKQNNDDEEYAVCEYSYNFYWKMLSFMRWAKNA